MIEVREQCALAALVGGTESEEEDVVLLLGRAVEQEHAVVTRAFLNAGLHLCSCFVEMCLWLLELERFVARTRR